MISHSDFVMLSLKTLRCHSISPWWCLGLLCLNSYIIVAWTNIQFKCCYCFRAAAHSRIFHVNWSGMASQLGKGDRVRSDNNGASPEMPWKNVRCWEWGEGDHIARRWLRMFSNLFFIFEQLQRQRPGGNLILLYTKESLTKQPDRHAAKPT